MIDQGNGGHSSSRPPRRRRKGGGRSSNSRNRNRNRQGNDGRRGGGFTAIPEGDPTLEVSGILQVMPQGHGFLRSPKYSYNPEPDDAAVPRVLVAELELVTGVELTCMAVPASQAGRAPVVAKVQTFNAMDAEQWKARKPFKSLTAESPDERIRLESSGDEISMRVVDLVAPIGKGQRCLIVAPPKAGKTVLLQKIAHSVSTNHPEIHLMVLLVDERPEEVTDMRRNVQGEVLASSSDELTRNHLAVAEMVLERAKTLVECGRDVVILLDSITRLARAYNSEQRGSGRVLSGGIDARTMEKPRRFFGAARKAADGGSLTVIATALVDTGSRMDEVIFQEFKGTGNTEIIMDRKLFDNRIFPSIDIAKSGTRKEEMLLTKDEYQKIVLLRRALAPLSPAEAMRLLTLRLAKNSSNKEFLATMV